MAPRAFTGLLAALAFVWTLGVGTATSARYLQKTTNDGVYTKAQADDAKARYETLCADCHAFAVEQKRHPDDLLLAGDAFFKTWEGKPLAELVSTIVFTMPNDGRAAVDDPEALNLVAYILQQNGVPAGPAALTTETMTAVLVRPKTDARPFPTDPPSARPHQRQ